MLSGVAPYALPAELAQAPSCCTATSRRPHPSFIADHNRRDELRVGGTCRQLSVETVGIEPTSVIA
jgi:hypothetical protein